MKPMSGTLGIVIRCMDRGADSILLDQQQAVPKVTWRTTAASRSSSPRGLFVQGGKRLVQGSKRQ